MVDIYFAGEIVAGNSFMNGKPAKYNLRIFKDTFVLKIVYPMLQYYIDYKHFTIYAKVAYGPGVVRKQ